MNVPITRSGLGEGRTVNVRCWQDPDLMLADDEVQTNVSNLLSNDIVVIAVESRGRGVFTLVCEGECAMR